MKLLSSNNYKHFEVYVEKQVYKMPPANGYELTEYLQKNPNTQFISITTIDGDSVLINKAYIRTIKPIKKTNSYIDDETLEAVKRMRETIG